LGEGAAFVVMETLQSAQARGATILAELLGGASTGDRAVRWNMDASGEGLARCMRKALKNAERQPGQIDYVGAAGFAIPDYDQKEAQATERVFGPYGVPVGALSSRVGVSAATPVITLTSALLGMQAGFMPPGARLSNLMDGLHLDMVHTEPRSVPLNTALINSMAFGGTNASLIVERFKLGAQDS
jgi:3-oxoacyl-[acyl-carrier-protein] synthase II